MLTIHLLTKREGGIVTIQRKTSTIKNAETLRRREAFHPTGGVLRAQSFGRLCITQERMRVCIINFLDADDADDADFS